MQLITPGFGLAFWAAIALFVVVVLLRKFAFGPIAEALRDREQFIEDSLNSAKAAKEEMANLQADNEKILSDARDEKNIIIKEAKAAGDRMVEEAKDKAKSEASKIVEDAKREIENQKMAAMVEVKNLVGSVAIEIAEKVIRKHLSESNGHENFVKDLVKDIELN